MAIKSAELNAELEKGYTDMIFEIRISDQADMDLRNIYENIAFELQAPENAEGQPDRLEMR